MTTFSWQRRKEKGRGEGRREGGMGASSRFCEKLYLNGIQQRMMEQDTQPPLLASKCAPTYTHACIYHRHTHLIQKKIRKRKDSKT